MRTFYLFSINKQMEKLTLDNPYLLFKSLETIYSSKKSDLNVAKNLYEQIIRMIDKEKINNKIFNHFKNNDYYKTSLNYHFYYNKYKDEKCELIIKNSYMICNTNLNDIFLLKNKHINNYFVCDFDNKDYFWLKEMYA